VKHNVTAGYYVADSAAGNRFICVTNEAFVKCRFVIQIKEFEAVNAGQIYIRPFF
jgi:hypothetical protein